LPVEPEVEDEEHVLGVHLLGGAIVTRLLHEVLPAMVTPSVMGTSLPVRPATTTLSTLGESSRALSAFSFRRLTCPARRLVGGDENLRLGIVGACPAGHGTRTR
jgi:hypothetical protein